MLNEQEVSDALHEIHAVDTQVRRRDGTKLPATRRMITEVRNEIMRATRGDDSEVRGLAADAVGTAGGEVRRSTATTETLK